MKLSVIVPVYNERLYLTEVFRRICLAPLKEPTNQNTHQHTQAEIQKIESLEIIAIDDCSSDGSRDFLKKLSAEFSTRMGKLCSVPAEFKLICQPENQGKGAAVRVGIQQSTGDIVLIQDADLEYNPKDFPQLLAPILENEADAVFGSRFLGNRKRVLYFWHSVINHFLTGVFNMLSDLTLTDMETCYKAMRGNLARSIRLSSNRFGIEPEISARLAQAKVRIYEVGISYNGRTYSEGKKIGPKDGIAALFHILRYTLFGGSPYLPGMDQTLSSLLEASDRFYIDPLKKLLTELKIQTGDGRRVLEIGSGIGAITRELLKYGDVVASDINPDSVQNLNNKFSFVDQFSAVQWDATLAPQDPNTPRNIAAGQFDLIVAINVVEHLSDPKKALKQWASLLKPKGVIVVLVPFSQHLFTPIDQAVGHFKRYNQKDVVELIQETGGILLKKSFLNPLGIIGWYINGRILRSATLPQGQVKIYNFIKPWVWPIESILKRFVGLSIIAAGSWTETEEKNVT